MGFVYKKDDLYPDSILIRDFVGQVNVTEIINSWEYLLENDLIKSGIKGVIDNIIDCQLQMELDSFRILLDYLKKQERLRMLKLRMSVIAFS